MRVNRIVFLFESWLTEAQCLTPSYSKRTTLKNHQHSIIPKDYKKQTHSDT